METIFPTDDGIAGLFFIGWHRRENGLITRTGTVVVKRTYQVVPDSVNPANGRLTPAAEALPVFLQDQPEGPLLENGDFKAGTASWTPETGVSAVQQTEDQNQLLAVSGAIRGRVTQTVDTELPLGGRPFVLAFKAKADAATSIVSAELRAGNEVCCSINANLTTEWQPFSDIGTWPNTLAGSSVTVVLRAAEDAGRTVHYDDVAVIHVAYEHDLAADKAGADPIVLPRLNFVPDQLLVDGTPVLRCPAGETGTLRTFGWERRDVGLRKADAAHPPDPAAYPLDPPLPANFDNRFYNGYRRDPRRFAVDPSAPATESPPAPGYLAPGSVVRLTRTGRPDYGFRLGSEQFSARYRFYSGIGLDAEARWQSRDVPMRLDTLVLEPDDDRCYAVWRGVWELDDRAEDSYRRLTVSLA
jgi:hypothetical protein